MRFLAPCMLATIAIASLAKDLTAVASYCLARVRRAVLLDTARKMMALIVVQPVILLRLSTSLS